MDFRNETIPLPPIPEDVSIPQFILDGQHPSRPLRKEGQPWLIEDSTARQIGFEELRRRTFGLANAFKGKYNIGENDVVCIFSSNHVDYPTVIWATHRLGAVISGANPAYTTDELVYQLQASKSTLLVCAPDFLSTALPAARAAGIPTDRVLLIDAPTTPQGRAHPSVPQLVDWGVAQPGPLFTERKLSPGESKTKVAFLSFSSGTTGRPKAVAIPHYAVIGNVVQMAAHWRVNEEYAPRDQRMWRAGDVAAAVLPFFHIYGLVVNMHFVLFAGLSIVVIPKFNYEDYLRSIVRHKITHLLVVPPQVVLLCKHPSTKNYDLSHVRMLMAGAAPMSADLTNQIVKVLPNAYVGQGYGMTETSTTVCVMTTDSKIHTIGSAGRLMPGVTARILMADGSYGKFGDVGEIILSAPSNALCYSNNAEATKETFLNIDGERWVRTGDEVYIDKNFDVFVVDRLKELIKVRGFQVAPAELEGHLLGHPDVSDACVVGVPDEYSGEAPLAFVVLSESAAQRAGKSAAEAEKVKQTIAKHVADHKTSYKHLRGGVEFIDAIPKNPSGKLLRRVLRDKAKSMGVKMQMKEGKAKL